ncbi:MAG: hypothetical protein XD81_0731 [Bacteroidetes bacterium 38_7]|nr:MAG: hypothetical protein XD81_0731 [Bacteroidetes bacterium 38_7]
MKKEFEIFRFVSQTEEDKGNLFDELIFFSKDWKILSYLKNRD